MTTLYDFTVADNQGKPIELSQFRGKVVLIVNTASKCGFTPQYKELEALHRTYQQRGLVILAFPCNQFGAQEPASNSEIAQFCEVNYGVTFPLMGKLNVNGPDAAPVFEYLKDHARGLMKSRAVKWNFTKFLVNKEGIVVKRYAPRTKPASIAQAIEELL